MTIQEFDKFLAENEENVIKFETLRNERLPQAKSEEDIPAILSGIASELGCDVAPSEFALKDIICEEVDEEDLDKVSGGRGCFIALTHYKDTNTSDNCWSDYKCVWVNKDTPSFSQAVRDLNDTKRNMETHLL